MIGKVQFILDLHTEGQGINQDCSTVNKLQGLNYTRTMEL